LEKFMGRKEMSRSSDQTSSAASMIRRFREGKPTSRVERESARESENGANDKEMWWVEKDKNDTDEFEQPRGSAPRPALKETRNSHNKILERLRKPTDQMTTTANNRLARDSNNRSLAAHKRTEWMTKTFLDRITLTMQFSKWSV
jgi:hypothetical protein